MTILRRTFFLLVLFLLPTPLHAQQKVEKCWPTGTTTYSLSSVNTTPGPLGVDVRGYAKHLTLNLILTSGTISTAVEVKTQAGGWVALAGGPLGNNFHGALNPDHIVIDFLRLNTGTCTACVAAAQLCSYPDEE